MHGSRFVALVSIVSACCPPPAAKLPVPPAGSGAGSAVAAPVVEPELDKLTEGAKLRGFTVAAVFLDGADQPIGARFVHDATQFQLDYLKIESAPQGYIWVNSFPSSDKGEPHTQEHLLLGKGNRGRRLGNSEAMALATSSAFTEQWHTAYHFNTVAGPDVYWSVFENHLDTLLNPDYTDEEIRREVRNFGVDKADDGTLRLEEKGTVYNEMVRYYEDPEAVLYRTAKQLAYGPKHPIALESGGYPDAIRTMTPADIRAFHASAYHLANMGMIGAYPSSMSLATVLDQTAAVLAKEQGRKGVPMSEANLPKPDAAPAGALRVVDYPYADATNPGPVLLVWPATRDLDATERTLLELFLSSVAGDESTPVYKKLIDGKTRVLELGASGVGASVSTEQGQPIFLGLSGVKPDKLDDRTLRDVRTLVMAELARIARLPDGDPELVAFDQRVQGRVIDLRRRLAKFLDSPPGFGSRDIGATWRFHLYQLGKTKGFKKSVTMRPELVAIEHILAGPTNPWRDRVKAWGLTTEPYGIAARPSPELRKELDRAREQRLADELARLQKQYGTKDAQSTLARFQAESDATTKQLEATAKAADVPPLVASPPMTLDEGLKYETGELAATRTFTATFDSMQSSRVQLAFSLPGALPPDDELFLAALPTLLGDAGVIENGTPVPAGEVKDRLRKEVLDLSAYFIGNPRTHRDELVVAGAGNSVLETRAALAWMRRVMFAPDWRIENLPRLRDLVDQQLTELRHKMLGAEEHWVHDPRDAWWLEWPLEGHTDSFLTQAHDLHRLRWMLLDPRDPKATAEATKFLASLADAKTLARTDLEDLAKALASGAAARSTKATRWVVAATKLSPKAAALAREAGKDLSLLVGELPDNSLAGDWSYLCRQMAKDLAVGAPAALARLEAARAQIIQGNRARLVEVGSTASQRELAADVDKLVRELPIPQVPKAYGTTIEHPFRDRLKQREPTATNPVFVGLVAPSTSSGVFANLAPSSTYSDSSDDGVLDYLASNLYTGHGAHSIFAKTWAAGLAYSNGLHPLIDRAALDYYAERCPLLPQTIRFVIDELRKQKPDANIARYAVAGAFSSRIADGFEARAGAMAADLVDGVPPDAVRQFRSHVLDAAKRADLADVLYARMPAVYGKVLPGYTKLAPAGIYFVIGNAKQLAAYQDYLHAAVGKDATLFTLYPRDFWIPAKL